MPSEASSTGLPSRRGFLKASAATAVLFAGWQHAPAQAPGQFVPVEPVSLPLDKPGVWTLNFAYTPIRIITVDTPDRGKRTAW
ncbi:MAG: twin-arginine translocation signal domain-containing protein, partial [Fimbriiglobus sp.]